MNGTRQRANKQTDTQLALFETGHRWYEPDASPPLPRHQAGSPTSRAAAERVAPRRGTVQAAVLAFVATCDDGATREEIAIAIGRKESTVCGAVDALKRARWLLDSGRTRKTSAGCDASVLIVRTSAPTATGQGGTM